jgi:hypothetical protein
MKRIILLAALLVAVSACSTTTPTNTNTPSNTNANTSATPKAEATATDADIIAKEKEVNEALKADDKTAFGNMLTDDFVLVTSDAVYDKAGTMEGVKGFKITEISFSDWKVLMLDKDTAVVTYKSKSKGVMGSEEIPEMSAYATSAWVKRGDKWMGIYHQETEVKAPKGEAMGSKEPAKPAATPGEAKPAAPVTADADPIKRENQVWDALKKKDYDTFASFLADDQIEVWESGQSTKAKSLEGVKQFNASGAVLSEFKTVKLDDDATLVTYLVKGPAPSFSRDGERQSSIWVNRGGKWLAVFHQGTSVRPPPPPAPKK